MAMSDNSAGTASRVYAVDGYSSLVSLFMTLAPPPAVGVRLPWSKLPARLLAALERWLDVPVMEAVTQPGGFSPGAAARVRTRDGRRVFIKAVGPELNPDAPAIYRREAHIVAALPPDVPAPRLLWTYDEGPDGWIMLVCDDIEGRHPAQPWLAHEMDRVLETLVSLSTVLTPSPIAAAPASDTFATNICGWRRLQAGPPDQLDVWSACHLDALADLEAHGPAAVAGDTLVHMDVRADNLLMTPNRVVLVDWPHACVGAAWVDVMAFAPSVAMQGGPEPEHVLIRHPAARHADPNDITAAVASLAGYFTSKALLPAPPGIPTLRPFQAAQGVVARRWLAQRTRWS
ncbi:MAG: phosphotransferase family protein [Chloroflexota bacterium]